MAYVEKKPTPPQLTSTGWMLNTNREQSASSPHWEKKYLSTQFKQCINLRELPSADSPFPHLHCLKNVPYEYLLYAVVSPSASGSAFLCFLFLIFFPGISRGCRFPRTLRLFAGLCGSQYQPSANVQLSAGSVAQQVTSRAGKPPCASQSPQGLGFGGTCCSLVL